MVIVVEKKALSLSLSAENPKKFSVKPSSHAIHFVICVPKPYRSTVIVKQVASFDIREKYGRNFMFNGTATFSGKHFVLGCFERDYICLKDLWDSAMHEVLGLEAVAGDKFRQEVQFPWNAEVREIENDARLMDVLTEFERRKPNINLNQQPNLDLIQQSNPKEEPIVLTDSSSNSDGSIMDDGEDEVPNAMDDSEDEVPNAMDDSEDEANAMDDSEDEVPNAMDDNEDEVPNENIRLGDELLVDSGDENDGLSDVNEDDIMGTAFRPRDDGRITIEVGQLFRNNTHFREVLLDYSVQEGFKLRRIKNEKRRITYGCEANGCPWRAHGSPTFDRVTYMLKTLRNSHNCLAIPKNRDVTSAWLGKRFELLIKENPDINIRVLGSVILRQCGVSVPDHTLFRAKKYALNIGSEDHKNSYSKLYRFKLDYLRDIFWPAATSSNKVAFLKAMDEIKQTSPEAHAYLSNISVETWAVHAFDSVCKSEHNTNNVVEAFNGWMNKHRALPMLTMMERVRRKFMKRIQDRYEAAILWESNIPPVTNQKLQKAQQKWRYLDPLRCGEDEFEVVDGNRRFVVELDKCTCQCGIWVISGVPCMHAMACITKKRDNVEDYVHDYLKKPTYLRTYSNNFHAIPDENLWPNGNFKTVLPPIKKRGVGRPKLSRKRGSTKPNKVQISVGFRCSICKEVGHNSRTCKNKSNLEAASTSTAPPRPQRATKRMTNEATNSSTYGSTHPTHSSTQTGNGTATSVAGNGTATSAASPRISGTVTRDSLNDAQPNVENFEKSNSKDFIQTTPQNTENFEMFNPPSIHCCTNEFIAGSQSIIADDISTNNLGDSNNDIPHSLAANISPSQTKNLATIDIPHSQATNIPPSQIENLETIDIPYFQAENISPYHTENLATNDIPHSQAEDISQSQIENVTASSATFPVTDTTFPPVENILSTSHNLREFPVRTRKPPSYLRDYATIATKAIDQ
ncbi:hypothetical protein EZV62_012308 [Acer yangbiense]|uniref:SWIM-type domain-containing protein n=1 Tax=Acer yangbiense TaxID=1000413 RepID=A0A5C7HVX5_9ROSI|nr:hypothetical protein EZV62_012308 [Acer yangbiense]